MPVITMNSDMTSDSIAGMLRRIENWLAAKCRRVSTKDGLHGDRLRSGGSPSLEALSFVKHRGQVTREEAQRVVCLVALTENDFNRELFQRILNLLKRKRGSMVPVEIWIKGRAKWKASPPSKIPPMLFGREKDVFPAVETILKKYRPAERRAVLIVADGGFVTPPPLPMTPGCSKWCVVLAGGGDQPDCIPGGVKIVCPVNPNIFPRRRSPRRGSGHHESSKV